MDTEKRAEIALLLLLLGLIGILEGLYHAGIMPAQPEKISIFFGGLLTAVGGLIVGGCYGYYIFFLK
ncbi:hypothetical protein A3A21_00850 [Candidatus Jorgensenbacteria bacterium RIFCSPLOWO2_01_FULL_45_25b]|uniref:Uncharacterized protein n=1 Tax=Candidatus Jorgensenbacteria bacterium RIFCSPLOWO2_01_FULL_45_25b TaxID=1798471 RepID=A0A1F6BV09_9BACT|nr:MAG: hypothetical protein A3A21_00850 [Candidatus Jorgensenbacteria bacterium RIFCSPLOWO2_01_FULL_45_25b]